MTIDPVFSTNKMGDDSKHAESHRTTGLSKADNNGSTVRRSGNLSPESSRQDHQQRKRKRNANSEEVPETHTDCGNGGISGSDISLPYEVINETNCILAVVHV